MILMDPNELKMNVCSFVHNNEELPCLNQLTSCLWNKVRVCDFNRIINNTSTIEAEPVIHAYVLTDEDGNIECSNCGSGECWGNYCMNCGAKMDRMME